MDPIFFVIAAWLLAATACAWFRLNEWQGVPWSVRWCLRLSFAIPLLVAIWWGAWLLAKFACMFAEAEGYGISPETTIPFWCAWIFTGFVAAVMIASVWPPVITARLRALCSPVN
jgi:hypothetical protein